ncbi:DUF1194 domain-containing protein [Blastochloris tepida]|uniref:VWFA domain-containing protein n=1 Tax=Blastochloris tepida TaxID=2233851 RepID=A0A348G2H6_9HYPH|nr:DUF1194 domain-containing protein [Blastochloris tepida]BBF93759.1 hypothetical protein BLTE_24440 [Blastochloris tepida]
MTNPRRPWPPLLALAALGALLAVPARADVEIAVDVELILAVDISYSMDEDEQRLQRDGYAQALVSGEFLDAVKAGPSGRIAIAYVEWAGAFEQQTVLDWSLLDGPQSARDIAEKITRIPLRRAFRTSISGAIAYAELMFDGNGYRGLRRVIDISGDGANNQGEPVTSARDRVLKDGIVINGLPLQLKRPNAAMMDVADLDLYYEDCVIGGPGAFVVPVRAPEQFAEAIRRKLVMEVAGISPAMPPVIRASMSAPRVDCAIGERMWRERMHN